MPRAAPSRAADAPGGGSQRTRLLPCVTPEEPVSAQPTSCAPELPAGTRLPRRLPQDQGSLRTSCPCRLRGRRPASQPPRRCHRQRSAPLSRPAAPAAHRGRRAAKRANPSVRREGTALRWVWERRHPCGHRLVRCYRGEPSARGRCGLSEGDGEAEGLQHRGPGSREGVERLWENTGTCRCKLEHQSIWKRG